MRSARPDDKVEDIQRMRTEGARLIEEDKRNYFFKAGKTLSNPGTSSKTYWTLIITVLNKAKIPMIPPLIENGLFVTDFTEKAHIFIDLFILQCTTIATIDTSSEIPQDPITTTLISDFAISKEKIVNIIRSLNAIKHFACSQSCSFKGNGRIISMSAGITETQGSCITPPPPPHPQ